MGKRGAWQVPGYTHIRELGTGGSGRVVLARHDADETLVAIKYLSRGMRADEEFVRRFRDEARLIAALDSPHIARLREYVEDEQGAAIVMELVDGVTLRRMLREEGATGPEAALVVLKGSLLGLAAAHEVGVVHRDFKPENVIVTVDGHSKLVDFGIAVPSGETGHMVGTPPYMAPELWEEAPASAATDVYAATVVFYECLAGKRPFAADNIAALAYQHQNAEPPLDPVQEPVRPLVAHGMAKSPAERPASARAFLAELEEMAVAAYGADWERRGRLGLGGLAATHVGFGVLPPPEFSTGTSLAQTLLTPAGKLIAAGVLAVVAGGGVVTAFVVMDDDVPGPPVAQPAATAPTRTPPATDPSDTAPPVTPAPSLSVSVPPERTPDAQEPITAPPSAGPETRPTAGPPTRPAPSPTRSVPSAEPSERPTRPTAGPSQGPTQGPGPSQQPSQGPGPSQEPSQPPSQEPEPPATSGPTEPPPATSGPEPEPPPRRDALIEVRVSASVGLPGLGGGGGEGGGGLLDADVGVRVGDLGIDLGAGLLGVVAVPGSLLLGRRWARRRSAAIRRGGPQDGAPGLPHGG
ncbi:serine/threonine-protein kinase [Thermocatellispora tengchongensis]|uniref:non-specific serine/threonine protein kinase n=1 Tax=Thermocatellispora tengchongensis TaxID=1073253 RepID=A0A840NX85_9ACTN|nr:serine/threonine-protein kinase [Thermocatellispora tengchongensis]MBB5132128.1 serine/threonine-protein kinase [Thermocatellispora tengchongensis]